MPSSESEGRTPHDSSESDVSRFLGELAKTRPRLSSPVPTDQELLVARLRSEWAQTMLQSPQFQEAIQLMNEKVLADMSVLNPLEDRDKVTVLAVKVQVIQEFMDELTEFCDRWDEVQQIQEQHARRDLETAGGYFDDELPYATPPLAGALS